MHHTSTIWGWKWRGPLAWVPPNSNADQYCGSHVDKAGFVIFSFFFYFFCTDHTRGSSPSLNVRNPELKKNPFLFWKFLSTGYPRGFFTVVHGPHRCTLATPQKQNCFLVFPTKITKIDFKKKNHTNRYTESSISWTLLSLTPSKSHTQYIRSKDIPKPQAQVSKI